VEKCELNKNIIGLVKREKKFREIIKLYDQTVWVYLGHLSSNCHILLQNKDFSKNNKYNVLTSLYCSHKKR